MHNLDNVSLRNLIDGLSNEFSRIVTYKIFVVPLHVNLVYCTVVYTI